MSIFGRRRARPVRAEFSTGCWVTEAPAMQQSIRSALPGLQGGQPVVTAELSFDHGLAGRVVVTWRNLIVGFVPESHRSDVARQLGQAGRAPLIAPGRVLQQDGEWRIWAGPSWPGEQPPPYPEARIAPTPPHILGIQLRNLSTPPH